VSVVEVEKVKLEKIGSYEVHPFASKFPFFDKAEFEDLVKSVQENGLRHPIVMDKFGHIVDGRNRLKACLKAGIDPEFMQLDENVDVIQYILDLNVRRRHLTTSQRAQLAADVLTLGLCGTTIKQEADRMKVSASSVKTAKRVTENAVPEIADAIREGRMDVKTADTASSETPEVQRELAASPDRTSARRAARKAADASFDKKKWANSAQRQISTILAKAPSDLREWATREIRDQVGGTARKEVVQTDLAEDGADVSLFDAQEFVDRIERSLKDVPTLDRPKLRKEIGRILVGDKSKDYLPDPEGAEDEVNLMSLIIAEVAVRAKQADDYATPDQAKFIKAALKSLKKLVPEDGGEKETGESAGF
jgi:ParB-like chromosome segregation protein Spo0J